MTGYLALVGIFAVMVLACFAFALHELWRPRDPGPLPIDVTRDIAHRHFARRMWRAPAPLRVLMEPRTPHEAAGGADDPVRLPAGSWAGDGRAFLVHGDGAVLPGSRVGSFVCNGVATIGEGATVADHAEGFAALVVESGATVGGRATSGEAVWLAPGASVRFAAAPFVRTLGETAPAPEPLAAWDEGLDADFRWLLGEGTPIDVAVRDVAVMRGCDVDAVEGLRRFEAADWRPGAAVDLATALAPTWLHGVSGWYLGAGTARVDGDLTLPDGTVVPFALVVDGTLRAGDGVRILGGVHARGDAVLGAACRVDGSLTARGSVAIGADCVVTECVSAGGDASMGDRAWIGVDRNGGLAAGGAASLGAGVVVRNKLYAEGGVSVPVPSFVA